MPVSGRGFPIGVSFDVRFSPDGSRLLVVRSSRLLLWDVASAAIVGSLPFANNAGADFSPDGRLVIAARTSGNATTLNGRTLEPLQTVPRRRFSMGTKPAFGTDARFLQATARGVLLVRDAETGEEILREQEAGRHIYEVARSPDGTRLAYCSSDRGDLAVRVRAWPFDVNQPQDALNLTRSGVILGLALSGDGRAAVRLSDRVIVCDVASGALAERPLAIVGTGGAVAWSPDGTELATNDARSDGSSCITRFTPDLEPIWSVDVPHACSVAYSPTADLIAHGSWTKGRVEPKGVRPL